jgi:peptidoglycan/LPS O-acetylase OafA/YrhL
MSTRNGSLDVLRCLAIAGVVTCHTVSAFGSSPALAPLQLGGKGVDLFFVLSGWLLGHQLLTERRDTGTIDVRRFWYRRWLRTLPAYYAVLGLTFAWQIAGRGSMDLCWSYVLFGQTYLLPRMPYFGVSWSLCVEEHFYLAVAPLLLLFATGRRAVVLWLLLLVPALCRHFGACGSLEQTHVRWDQCGAGVALAAVEVYAPVVWRRLCRAALVLASVAFGALGLNVLFRLHPEWGVGDLGTGAWTLMAVALVLLANSGPFWSQRFTLPGARFLADRAYALYLLHGEALALMKHTSGLSFLVYLVLTWGVSLLLAEALFRGVERPFLRAREWFAASRGREGQLVPAGAAA